MTKAEFVDRLVQDGRIGSKKQAAEALEAVLEGITTALSRSEPVNLTGFGKFSVSERGPRQGVNPRTGERITIAGGRVPKFSAGAALKAKVKA
jgi:DNA-binding protein HU-beta